MTVPYDTGSELAGLSAGVLSCSSLDEALAVVVAMAVTIVDDCDGCSLTTRDRGRPVAGTSSDEWARELDALQVVEQEGPCLDCLREASVMRSRDLATGGRFPAYGPRAAEHGARSALSLPVSLEGQAAGALDLYSRQPNAFGTEAVAVATLLAAHASLALQAATAYFSHRDLARQLQEALPARAVIEQAKGMLMAERRCSADDAFAELVRRSQHSNRKLREVAAEVVAAAIGEQPAAAGRSGA